MRAILRKSFLLWLALLAACTVQLAPKYDPSLVDGLNQTNSSALALFAALEGGSDRDDFPRYEQRYAELIGATEALQQRAAGREVPPLAARLAKLKGISGICKDPANPSACVNTSPASLGEVLNLLRKMRDQHRSKGLPNDILVLTRNGYDIAMGQAIAVENALKR